MKGSNWDKILLIVVAIAVVAVSGLVIAKTMSFAERFTTPNVKPDDTLPDTQTPRAVLATSFVQKDSIWKTLELKSGAYEKDVPLFVSIPIVESEGELIDMTDPQAKPLRPPVTNAWLLKNDLDYLNAGVLNQDPDGDGFTNIAEWDATSDPRDPASHPPYADKLVMHSREQEVYRLEFAARPDKERFQIKRHRTAKWREDANFLMRIGEVSDDQQFRLDSFEEKSAERNGITVDATVLTITYLPKNTTHTLVKKAPEDIPTYYAQLEFLLDPGNKFYVKEGETFPIAIDPETKYRVVKVNEDSTVITYQTGTDPEQTVEIKKK